MIRFSAIKKLKLGVKLPASLEKIKELNLNSALCKLSFLFCFVSCSC